MEKDNKKRKKKLGRPPKFNAIDLQQVESLASLGLTDIEIATVLKISERTLNYWKEKPEFLQSLKRGKVRADSVVLQSLYRKATTGGDTTAMIFWLKNRRRQDWRDRSDVGVTLDDKRETKELTDAELMEIAKGK